MGQLVGLAEGAEYLGLVSRGRRQATDVLAGSSCILDPVAGGAGGGARDRF